jgi:hypothetical protein
MKLTVLPLLFLFAVMVTAYPANGVKSPALNQSFDLKIGETASVQGSRMKISFKTVAEDSRCPEDVNCVWAGNAKIILSITNGGRGAKTLTLNSGLNPKHLTYQGYDIKLADVKPLQNTHKKISQSDYVITLAVTKI